MEFNALVAREIEKLKERLLVIGGQVEEALTRAVTAIENLDEAAARRIIEEDEKIDYAEVELEEECLKLLALHQPVAGDLRFIVTVLKVNNDLERIADLAVNLAENAIFLSGQTRYKCPFDFERMVSVTQTMLKDALDALVEMSTSKAVTVRQSDDVVDEVNSRMYDIVKEEIRKNPGAADTLINHMNISRCFERIADLSCNIAEDVIYLVSGEIVRH